MSIRAPLIAVIGSGTQPHTRLSVPLGKWIAERGCHLINGGGQGVMFETAKAFTSIEIKSGLAIGILPAAQSCETEESRANCGAPPGYPNAHIDLPMYSHLHLSGESGKDPASRNHIIILSASIVIALPGGAGTRTEMELALEYKKPLLIISPDKAWKEFANSGAVIVKTAEEAIVWLDQKIPKFLFYMDKQDGQD